MATLYAINISSEPVEARITETKKTTIGPTGKLDLYDYASKEELASNQSNLFQLQKDDKIKFELGGKDLTLEGAINVIKNIPSVAKLNKDGEQIVEIAIRKGVAGAANLTFPTHDFGDPTTWYQNSVRVSDETMSSGDGLVYSSQNPKWINIRSKKLSYPHRMVPFRDGTLKPHADWEPVIKVDGSTVTEGFTIDFAAGTVTFDTIKSGAEVKASYSHINGAARPSEWIIMPMLDSKFTISKLEIQFSQATDWAGLPMRYEIWAGGTLANYEPFSEALYDAGYGQYRFDYQGFNDLINIANIGNSIPILAGHSSPLLQFPFTWVNAALDSSQGALIRFWKEDDLPLGNADLATATVYLEKL